jgi:hypothetical protein
MIADLPRNLKQNNVGPLANTTFPHFRKIQTEHIDIIMAVYTQRGFVTNSR